jgi:hypothetical protein
MYILDIKKALDRFRFTNNTYKWITTIAIIGLITGLSVAYNWGGKSVGNKQKLENLEERVTKLEKMTENNSSKLDSIKVEFNGKIQKGYQDGISILETQQNSFKDQLLFIINYKNEDKELLKNAINIKNEYTDDYIKKTIDLALKDLNINYKKNNIDINKFNKINVSDPKILDTLIKKHKIIKIEQLEDNSYLVLYQ